MEPVTFAQISAKIKELSDLLDKANAQALSSKEVRGKYLLSQKMNALSNSLLKTLVNKPDLYPDRIDRNEFAELKNTYDNIPDLVGDLKTCIKKAEGWQISTGQNIAAIMLRLYRKLSADLPDMPDLKTVWQPLNELFKRGKRSDENGDDTNPDNPNTTSPAA